MGLKLSLVVILLLSLCAACKQSFKNNENISVTSSYNVFGPNDRIKVKKYENHHNFIGKLKLPNTTYCTAALVGEDLILTARHCLFSGGELLQGNYLFQLRLNDNQDIEESGTVFMWWGIGNGWANDWAIVKLEKSLGKKYGYFGVRPLKKTDELYLAGYGDINPSENDLYEQSVSCSVEKMFDDGKFFHSCDIGSGDSGGPIYTCDGEDSCVIVGIQSAHYIWEANGTLKLEQYSDHYANIGVNAKNFQKKILELRNN